MQPTQSITFINYMTDLRKKLYRSSMYFSDCLCFNTFHTHLSLYMNVVKPLSNNQGTRKKNYSDLNKCPGSATSHQIEGGY